MSTFKETLQLMILKVIADELKKKENFQALKVEKENEKSYKNFLSFLELGLSHQDSFNEIMGEVKKRYATEKWYPSVEGFLECIEKMPSDTVRVRDDTVVHKLISDTYNDLRSKKPELEHLVHKLKDVLYKKTLKIAYEDLRNSPEKYDIEKQAAANPQAATSSKGGNRGSDLISFATTGDLLSLEPESDPFTKMAARERVVETKVVETKQENSSLDNLCRDVNKYSAKKEFLGILRFLGTLNGEDKDEKIKKLITIRREAHPFVDEELWVKTLTYLLLDLSNRKKIGENAIVREFLKVTEGTPVDMRIGFVRMLLKELAEVVKSLKEEVGQQSKPMPMDQLSRRRPEELEKVLVDAMSGVIVTQITHKNLYIQSADLLTASLQNYERNLQDEKIAREIRSTKPSEKK